MHSAITSGLSLSLYAPSTEYEKKKVIMNNNDESCISFAESSQNTSQR